MLTPILCFTCGCPIGDKDDVFKELKKRKIAETKDVNIDCSDILEKLDIKNDCCKMHVISANKFEDLY